MVVGRCMKCKENREMKDTKFELNAKGRPIVRGKCTKCGTSMYKILSTEEGLKHGLKVKTKTGKGVEGGSRKSRKSKGSRKSRKSAASKGSRKGSRKSRKGSRKGSRKSRSRK